MWTSTRFTERFGRRYPIVQGPLGGGSSTPELVAAVSNAGGLGSLGGYHLEPDAIRRAAADIRRLTAGPFALNLWIPQEREDEGYAAARAGREDLLPFYGGQSAPLAKIRSAADLVAELAEEAGAALGRFA
jgi:nitronate monooxygenase